MKPMTSYFDIDDVNSHSYSLIARDPDPTITHRRTWCLHAAITFPTIRATIRPAHSNRIEKVQNRITWLKPKAPLTLVMEKTITASVPSEQACNTPAKSARRFRSLLS